MAVIIRLKRFGKRGYPTYRLVAIDESKKRQGKEIETLGNYNPNLNPPSVNLVADRIKYWLTTGAKTSDTVRQLIKKHIK